MRTNERGSVVRRVSSAVVLALAILASPALATDIAWHSTTALTYQNDRNFKREGTAVFKTGETARFVGDGSYYMTNEKGLIPHKMQYMLRFDDGSTITIRFTGTRHPFDGTTSGAGEFINGTGRFDGIAGHVSVVGQVGGSATELDWVGSYSLPKN